MSVAETYVDERKAGGTASPILGMALFVASEAMFFAALFGAYFTIYAQTTVWPPLAIPIVMGRWRPQTATGISLTLCGSACSLSAPSSPEAVVDGVARRRSAEPVRIISRVAFGLGLFVLVAGLVLWFTAHERTGSTL